MIQVEKLFLVFEHLWWLHLIIWNERWTVYVFVQLLENQLCDLNCEQN